MLGTLLKLFAYTQAPKTVFALRHPEPVLRFLKLPYDAKHAYAPRIAVVATAAVVAPLAYTLGRKAGARKAVAPPVAGKPEVEIVRVT